MKIYHISSLVKACLGIMILVSSLRFIDPWIDPITAVMITSVALILIVWGVGFYFYLLMMSLFSDKKYEYLASYAYKLSLLSGCYISLNWFLIGFTIWSWRIGGLLLISFLFMGGIVLELVAPTKLQE